MKNFLEDYIPVFVLMLLIIVGIVVLGVVLGSLTRERHKDWTLIEGVVVDVDADVDTTIITAGKTPIALRDVDYDVKYTFEVDGVVYGGCDTMEVEYVVGSIIYIRYNPNNPTESIISN